jgi:hypothetical protein
MTELSLFIGSTEGMRLECGTDDSLPSLQGVVAKAGDVDKGQARANRTNPSPCYLSAVEMQKLLEEFESSIRTRQAVRPCRAKGICGTRTKSAAGSTRTVSQRVFHQSL